MLVKALRVRRAFFMRSGRNHTNVAHGGNKKAFSLTEFIPMPSSPLCTHCELQPPESGYLNDLCADCRKSLSRYPITSWVKWLAAGVAVLFVISLFNLPKVFNANIRFKKANRLLEEHKYISAENALREITAAYPQDFKSAAKLAVAAYHNQHFMVMDSVLEKWVGKHVEEQELVSELNSLPDIAGYYMIQDERLQRSIDSAATVKERIAVLKKYHLQHQSDLPVMFHLASEYFNDSSYAATVALCEEIKMENPEAAMLYPLQAAAYREQREYQKAIDVCNQLLAIHAESIPALAAQSKVLLKWKKDNEALARAQQAYALDPHHIWSLEAMALTAHFTGNAKLRDDMIAELKSFNDSSTVALLRNIINGNIQYRN